MIEKIGPIVSKNNNGYIVRRIINTDAAGNPLPDSFAVFDSTGSRLGTFPTQAKADAAMLSLAEEYSQRENPDLDERMGF